MRTRANSQDLIDKIKDRNVSSLFRVRKNRLQSISKQNLRLYNKICNQKSNYSSENRSKSHRSDQQKQQQIQSKSRLNMGEALTNITNITHNTRLSIYQSKISLIQQPNLYSLPSLSKQWNSVNIIRQSNNNYKDQQYFKFKQNDKIDQAWNRFKNKNKLRSIFQRN